MTDAVARSKAKKEINFKLCQVKENSFFFTSLVGKRKVEMDGWTDEWRNRKISSLFL